MDCRYNEYGHLVIERICRDGDIEPVFGDFSWRYFQRGIFDGARLSGLRYFFRPWLGYETGNYADRLLNPLNPTPFLITVALLAASWTVRIYDKRQAGKALATTALSILNRCDGCGASFRSSYELEKIEGKGYLCASCRSASVPTDSPLQEASILVTLQRVPVAVTVPLGNSVKEVATRLRESPKCPQCGNVYPSPYYFKLFKVSGGVTAVCNACYVLLPESNKADLGPAAQEW